MAIAAFCVFAQLTTAAHLLLVRHTFCAEHGVAVDASRTPRAPDCHSHDDQRDTIGAPHDEPGVEGHDHCELAVDRSGRIGLPPAAVVQLPLATLVEHVREPARLALSPGAAVLLLAPKTSPPA